jgi:hypothetical protein
MILCPGTISSPGRTVAINDDRQQRGIRQRRPDCQVREIRARAAAWEGREIGGAGGIDCDSHLLQSPR